MELTTPRLRIRPFAPPDAAPIDAILAACFGDAPDLAARADWVAWSAAGARWHAALHQPPYGDYAVVLAATGELVGSVGYVPLLAPFGQLPGWPGGTGPGFTAELGLFWAIAPAHQGRGLATEAAQALVTHAFTTLHAARVVAGTDHGNRASQAVMRHLGMTLVANPLPDPPWFQVTGWRAP